MSEYLADAAIRGAVMIPVVIVVVLIWFLLRQFGAMRLDMPFDINDLRTWPLSAVLFDAALFGFVFAASAAAMAENPEWAVISGAIAASVTIGSWQWTKRWWRA